MTKAYVIGKIANCDKGVYLSCKSNEKYTNNVDASFFIPVGSEVMVDLENSTNYFYKICVVWGVEGYCLKKYVEFKRVTEEDESKNE